MATITLAVTVVNVSGANYYFIDGVRQATISATPGNTYKFDQADSSNSGHPLRLSITSNGTHSGGSAYTDGVTTSGTPGSSGAYTQIVVDATTVQTLYYYCTQHSGMGGSFNTGSSATVQFQDIKGFDIQNLSSDSTSVGQIYYNSTSGQFKAVTTGVGTWASGGALNTGRKAFDNAAGTLPAGLVFSGYTTTAVANTESYNGTSWTETGDLNTARYISAGDGTATAAFCVGGTPGPKALNEHFDGSSWTEAGDLNTGRQGLGATGTTTASLAFAGESPSGDVAITELYNGSSWTEVGDLNQAGYLRGSAGISTASLVFGGSPGPGSTAFFALTESWNGSAWTEVSDLNTARTSGGSSGNYTAALFFGGQTPPNSDSALTEDWNGTAWTEVSDLSTAQEDLSGEGSSTAAFSTGGNPQIAATEEWTLSDFEVKTLTTS